MNEWWYKSDLTRIPISEMTDSHLSNAIHKFREMAAVKDRSWQGKTLTQWVDILCMEKDRRLTEVVSPKPVAKFEEEYQWAVDHPNDRVANAFLNLPWWSGVDPIEAAVLAGRIQEKMSRKLESKSDARIERILTQVLTNSSTLSGCHGQISSELRQAASTAIKGSKLLRVIKCAIPGSVGYRIINKRKVFIQKHKISSVKRISGKFYPTSYDLALDHFIIQQMTHYLTKHSRDVLGVMDYSCFDTILVPSVQSSRPSLLASVLKSKNVIRLPSFCHSFLFINSKKAAFTFAIHSLALDENGFYANCGWIGVDEEDQTNYCLI
jgi:hypothetical protein